MSRVPRSLQPTSLLPHANDQLNRGNLFIPPLPGSGLATTVVGGGMAQVLSVRGSGSDGLSCHCGVVIAVCMHGQDCRSCQAFSFGVHTIGDARYDMSELPQSLICVLRIMISCSHQPVLDNRQHYFRTSVPGWFPGSSAGPLIPMLIHIRDRTRAQ